ncbi:class I SAM-dependent methyltransferase [Rhizobium sp. KVB221]|uniref:Class I SAM-dependent methyltransferase n=1 Tax=Rhizobium setariae TaxID=2801340 RepID=A0A936YNQ2_9HYPH|nr:cyclopropane-fatty-acyl-phospholipid synthase family protein [Rhizobium setariae]MBL0372858.1 class I SAM-dependent methyltransferase [Rhizobium setariae]
MPGELKTMLAGGKQTIVTAENVNAFAKGLPLTAQLIFKGLVNIDVGSLSITLPDGRNACFAGTNPGPNAAIRLSNWNLLTRSLSGGTIAAAETYIDGDWDSPDIGIFLELFLVNQHVGGKFANGARGLFRLLEKFRHWMNANTRKGSKRNISAHYDLGNEFYKAWLDPTMTYSSALYSTGANDLSSAQKAKYRALAEATGIGPDDHVLEIGCGWGGFAEFAASEIGCRVTGLTISNEQLKFARDRIQRNGLADKVELKFQDYRDERGVYDRIVSIEMFEAVGEKYWPVYFEKLRSSLKPGGRAGLQVITIDEKSFDEYKANPDFIQKYIFPGGMLPTVEHLTEEGRKVGFSLVSDFGFGPDYARTLSEWRQKFWGVWERLQPLGFDQRFKRLWEFYFFYCEAGFRTRNIDVRHVVYT